jgi:hypothetical protein
VSPQGLRSRIRERSRVAVRQVAGSAAAKPRKDPIVTRFFSCALLAASLSILFPGAARALDAAELPNAIENAKTAADHEAIAEALEAQAKEARAAAKRHRQMSAAYKKHPPTSGSKGVRSPLHQTMPPHCDKLVSDYEAAAAEYEAMAGAHRDAGRALE